LWHLTKEEQALIRQCDIVAFFVGVVVSREPVRSSSGALLPAQRHIRADNVLDFEDDDIATA
jgi:hypothetical protein